MGAALVVGFALHNTTEGLAIVAADAPAGDDKRRRPLARVCRRRPGRSSACAASNKVTTLRVRDAPLAGLAQFPRLSEEGIRRARPPTSELSDRHPW